MDREDTARSVLLWGEDNQKALEQLSVGIVGMTQAAQLLSVSLLSLGVGTVLLIDNARAESGERNFLIPKMEKGDSMVKAFATPLDVLFPNSEIIAYHSPPLEAILYRELPDILFDLSGNAEQNNRTLTLARRYNRTAYFGAWDSSGISISSQTAIASSARDEQSCFSGLLTALCAEEVRKHAFSLEKYDAPMTPGTTLSIAPHLKTAKLYDNHAYINSRKIRTKLQYRKEIEEESCSGRVLIVGAGALGNFAALHLGAESSISLDIYDGDVVEASNLNRQFLFRAHEGEPKASSLAAELKKIYPECDITGYDTMLDECVLSSFTQEYDLILSCVDTIEARILLSDYAVEHNIPLLNGGTSSLSGTMEMYLPSITASLSFQAGLEGLLALENEERGCALASPSVIMPNAAIGGLMAHYAKCIISGSIEPCTVRYHSFSPTRLSFLSNI